MDRFDLEQQILQCWNLVDDIRTLNEEFINRDMTKDQVSNYLLGLETIYNIKFEKLFDTFSALISTSKIK